MSSRRRSSSPRLKKGYSIRRWSSSSDSSVESPKKRDPKDLPDIFGRKREMIALNVNDERSVLQQMGTAFTDSPLHTLYKYLEGGVLVKIWTRTNNSVRGILSGYIIAFDKHWNLIMRDCTDVFHKSKKSKTPFLRSVDPNEVLPDFPAKVMKKKAGKKTTDAGPPRAEDESETREKPALDPPKDEPKGAKKKRGKKNKTKVVKKSMKQIFIRGANVIMICPAEPEEVVVEESEEEP